MISNRLQSVKISFRYKRAEDAKMALEQMEGFELAGRTVSPPVASSISALTLH